MNNFIQIIGKVRIHPLFWCTFIIAILTARFLEILLLFTIVCIHELGHIIVAHYYKWRITKIQLLPFGGVAEVDEHGNKPLKEEVMVLIAGPIQHIWMIGLVQLLHHLGYIDTELYSFLFWNNLSLLSFNLLPIWPLDGGKLLFSGFSVKYPFKKGHLYMMQTSIACLSIFIVVTIFMSPTNITMWCMIVFLAISMYIEWKQRNYIFVRFLLNRYYGKNENIKTIKNLSVVESDKLFYIFTNFQRGYKHMIVLKNRTEQKIIDEREILHAYFVEKRTNLSIGELFP